MSSADSTFGYDDCLSFCRYTDEINAGLYIGQDATFCCQYEYRSLSNIKVCKIWRVDFQVDEESLLREDDVMASFLYYNKEYIDQEEQAKREEEEA